MATASEAESPLRSRLPVARVPVDLYDLRFSSSPWESTRPSRGVMSRQFGALSCRRWSEGSAPCAASVL